MRVIAGKHKGRKINVIEDSKLRPTTGIAREALFNILTHGRFNDSEQSILHEAVVLDLFCGCGALSIEAISRGAKQAILIDVEKKHLVLAKENIEKIGELDKAKFLCNDSANPPLATVKCNLVFIDPPYRKNLVARALDKIQSSGWLLNGAIIVVESGKKEDLEFPKQYITIDKRNYGNSTINILQWFNEGKKLNEEG